MLQAALYHTSKDDAFHESVSIISHALLYNLLYQVSIRITSNDNASSEQEQLQFVRETSKGTLQEQHKNKMKSKPLDSSQCIKQRNASKTL
jgi:cell fate regulator YaaT (PSP1 superfamily)